MNFNFLSMTQKLWKIMCDFAQNKNNKISGNEVGKKSS